MLVEIAVVEGTVKRSANEKTGSRKICGGSHS